MINKIKSILKEIDLNQKLNTDDSLPKLIEWFKKNQLSVEEKKELESSQKVLDSASDSKKDSVLPSSVDYNSGDSISQRISVLNLKK